VKRNTLFLVVVFIFAFGASGLAQQQRLDAATKVLIPSSARTAAFTSFLAVINLDSQDNAITITARRENGSVIGTPRSIVLSPNGRFRSTDILGELGGGLGEFGPITVESTNGRILSAVSEVSSVQGPGGFFPGVNVQSAWMQGYMTEVIDTGDFGAAQTFRTNLGLNTVAGNPANVSVSLFNNAGTQVGSTISYSVPGNGMRQINGVVRELLNSGGAVTGQNGYLRITSNQPIHAWASKIENGTGDPSFQIGIGALSGAVISQVLPSGSDARNNFLFIALALVPAVVFLVVKLKGIDLYPDDSLARQMV
jgi:hypothetical protein